ncbi:MAG: hypothetical protein HY858_14070 [Candidatus Solibacter usitatus]|nr:hypothetical protein [Candidatus Solibacter usitatus]
MPPSAWVPFEWPADWRDPALLRLLDPGPINCLLLPQDAPTALRAAAEVRGLACPANIPWRSWKEVPWHSPAEPIAIADGVWPELASQTPAGGAQAGPTGLPWLDANGWLLLLARAHAARTSEPRASASGFDPHSSATPTLWINSPPPSAPPTPSSYALAACEAAAYGARRPLWLSPEHARALAAGNTSATQDWTSMLATARWLEQRRPQWSTYETFARLLIVSDFTGPNQYNAAEVLNLAARRNLAYLPVESSRLQPAHLKDRRAVLYIDPQPPPAAIQPFVQSGGLLLCLPSAALPGLRPSRELHPRFHLYDCGKGRLAVSKAGWDDPFLLAQDAHALISRRHDPIRLFNAGSICFHHTVAPGGLRWFIHLLNYSHAVPAHQVVLQSWTPLASALLHQPGAGAPVPLEFHREPGRLELYLPPIAAYAAVELVLTHA